MECAGHIRFETFTELHYSQTESVYKRTAPCLRHLQNYTTLKHSHVRALVRIRLRHLQSYTTLKPVADTETLGVGLKHLQNYATLKQRLCFNFLAFGLRYL